MWQPGGVAVWHSVAGGMHRRGFGCWGCFWHVVAQSIQQGSCNAAARVYLLRAASSKVWAPSHVSSCAFAQAYVCAVAAAATVCYVTVIMLAVPLHFSPLPVAHWHVDCVGAPRHLFCARQAVSLKQYHPSTRLPLPCRSCWWSCRVTSGS